LDVVVRSSQIYWEGSVPSRQAKGIILVAHFVVDRMD